MSITATALNTPDVDITKVVQSKHGATRRIIAIFADGVQVGTIIGRPDRWDGPRWWDYKVGTEAVTVEDMVRATYGHKAQSGAIEALMEKVTR